MKHLLILSLFLIGCVPSKKKEERIFTSLQVKYIQSLNLAEQVYMEDCLSNSFRSISNCMDMMHKDLNCNIITNKTPGISDIAIGTALGVGASKMLFGK